MIDIVEETVKILKDHPHLKYYEALAMANEIYKKDPQDGNPKGTKKNNFK